MKKLITLIIFLTSAFAHAQSTLTVVLSGVESKPGHVRVSVWNDEKEWLKGAAVRELARKVEKTSMSFTFKNLENGVYAV